MHPTCDVCGQTFQRRDRYLVHLCKRHPPSLSATKYKLVDPKGPLKRVLASLNALETYELCFHELFCIPNKFPPIIPSRGGIRNFEYELYGNPLGIRQIGTCISTIILKRLRYLHWF